jgi:hypothetical protein
MDFNTLKNNLSGVVSKLEEMTLDSAMDVKETIADLNVEQLERGVTAQDKPIVPQYQSENYAAYKKAIGAKPKKFTPDLKVSGDFHRSIHAKRYNKLIETDSSDWKAEHLIEKYEGIMGLTKKNQAELNKEILPNLVKRIKDELLAG